MRDIILAAGPWPTGADPRGIAAAVEREWKGARVFVTIPAARRHFRRQRREPVGAAERFAACVEACVLAGGGDDGHVERILIACMGSRLHI